MPRFFIPADRISEGTVTVTGDDAHHISRSLRMAAGERITVCDGTGTDYECELTAFLPDRVLANVLSSAPSASEPPYHATVFQALPKGEKLDAVIQKAVECGASEIVPFESERCVVRMTDGEEKKRERRNRIALEAAKQCGRGIIPTVAGTLRFEEAITRAAKADLALFCYEGEGTQPLPEVLNAFCGKGTPTVSVMVGSEGGFSKREADAAKDRGMIPVGLGTRILRTETAAAFVLACLSYRFELSR